LGTDVDTLRRMLNDLDPEVQLQAMRQEELAKRAGDARDIMTKLTDAINSLIIKNKPLMDSIVEGVNKFSDFIYQINKGEKSLGDLGKKIFGMLPWWGKLFLVVGAVNKVLSVSRGLLTGFQLAATGFSKAAGIVKSGFTLMSGGAKGLMRALGPVALLLSGILAAYQTYKKIKEANIAGDKSGAASAGALGGAGAGALTGAGIGAFFGLPGMAVGALIGGAVGALGGVGAAQVVGVDDASVPLQITKFNNQDTFERVGNSVVAAKPDGTLDKAIRESVEKQTAVLVEAIQNAMNVQVQVGDQQLGDVVVKAMNSTRGRNSISPFYEG